MKNKDIMGKVIKITEEELHNIIKTKIQEALEHNVDLEYSPAIGNKKRGPGKNSMDQMKKRRNTRLDEELNERDIYRRLPDGELDYDGDDGEDEPVNGTTWIELPSEAYAYGFREVFGKVPENLNDILEDEELMDEVEVKFSISSTEHYGDYWTPGYTETEIDDWEIVSDLSRLSDEFKKVVHLAAEYEIDSMAPAEIADMVNESTGRRFDKLISESVKKVISERLYGPTPLSLQNFALNNQMMKRKIDEVIEFCDVAKAIPQEEHLSDFYTTLIQDLQDLKTHVFFNLDSED